LASPSAGAPSLNYGDVNTVVIKILGPPPAGPIFSKILKILGRGGPKIFNIFEIYKYYILVS